VRTTRLRQSGLLRLSGIGTANSVECLPYRTACRRTPMANWTLRDLPNYSCDPTRLRGPTSKPATARNARVPFAVQPASIPVSFLAGAPCQLYPQPVSRARGSCRAVLCFAGRFGACLRFQTKICNNIFSSPARNASRSPCPHPPRRNRCRLGMRAGRKRIG
jgi:hypothetical protein